MYIKMRMSIRKGITYLAIAAMLMSSATGCIQKKSSQAQNSQSTQSSQKSGNSQNSGTGSKPIKIEIPAEGKGSGTIVNNDSSKTKVTPKTQDTDLTKKLEQEKEVLGGQIYEQGDMILAAINIKSEVAQADAQALANRYMEELKKKYPGKAINVQAVQNKKNIANLTYQPS